MQTFAAAPAKLALAHNIGPAMLSSLSARSDPLFLTPERAHGQAPLQTVNYTYGAALLVSMVNALAQLASPYDR